MSYIRRNCTDSVTISMRYTGILATPYALPATHPPGLLWMLIGEAVEFDPKGQGTGAKHIDDAEVKKSNIEPQFL